MGRIYDVNPDEAKGERSGLGCRLEQLGLSSWSPVPCVTRTEFDDDADEGPALVTAYEADQNGKFIIDKDANGLQFLKRHQFRAHVRIVRKPVEVVAPVNAER